MIGTINAELKKIVESYNAVYLRGTPSDANISLDDIELKPGQLIAIFSNLPIKQNPIGAIGTRVYREVPIQIQVLALADLDDTTEQGDAHRDKAINLCDAIYDQVIRADFISQVVPFEGYEIDTEATEKIYDKILTGVTLSFTIYLDRETYFC